MIIKFETISSVVDGKIAINHHFKVSQFAEENESINDFHMFCLSIIRDLINNVHKFDEYDKVFSYDFGFTEDEKRALSDMIDHMSGKILGEKMSFKKSMDDLINNK